MIKLLTVVGARPQFIKAAALSRAIRENFGGQVHEVILHTGQHYDPSMSDIFFNEMQIPAPSHQLHIGSESHGVQTGLMLKGIEESIQTERPHGLILYGDTNSTLAGAIAASKLHVPVIHVEAGLRSFNKKMPEEINRIVCDHVSTLLFSPTRTGVNNLQREGIVHSSDPPFTADRPGVFHCGDLMYDNTLYFKEIAQRKSTIARELGLQEHPYILATIHRPSNTDQAGNLLNILRGLRMIGSERNIPVIVPLHPRTMGILKKLRALGTPGLDEIEQKVRFIPAVSFFDMISLESGASVILTDSGGVQKEAWFMQKPVVVLREETEWVEIIESGNGILAGPDTGRIHKATTQYLDHPPAEFPPLFGDGNAAREILRIMTSFPWKY